MAERAQSAVVLPGDDLDSYSFLLLGEQCTIFLTDEKKISYNQNARNLFLPKKDTKKRLVQWLKENAARILTSLTQQIADRMQTSYKSVTISYAKTKWGSCSFDNAIRYSYRLLYAPKDVIEYVVLHELAHTKHKNHSPRFWAEVEKYMPDWKQKRGWLKGHGALMQIF